jgi:hypothetical protein
MADNRQPVKLMSEYATETPLWQAGEEMAPEEFGLSSDLSEQLLAWQRHFESHYSWQHGWDSVADANWYAVMAETLVNRLRDELASDLRLVVDLWPLE